MAKYFKSEIDPDFDNNVAHFCLYGLFYTDDNDKRFIKVRQEYRGNYEMIRENSTPVPSNTFKTWGEYPHTITPLSEEEYLGELMLINL